MTAIRIPDLAGRVVLVTGASTGIGAAVARALGQQGARVGVHYHASRAAAEAVAAGIDGAFLVEGDMADARQAAAVVDRTAGHFGRLDVLINNAGSLIRRVPLAEADDAVFDEIMDLNARSVFATCRAAIPHFRAAGAGNIINTTSIAARTGGSTGGVIYAAAKGFVSTLTRGLAKELAPHRIRVNAVSPGVTATAFHEKFSDPGRLKALGPTIPAGRVGVADDLVGSYLYLAADSLSGYVTGQVLEVSGGQLIA